MATTELVKGVRATHSTIALKLAMAASGIVFILFTLVHMYGNLKAFAGHDAYNEYAEHLRTLGTPMLPHAGILWILRIVLIVSLVVHVASAITLAKRAAKARPVKYAVKKNVGSSVSSRTMRWGGVTLFIFIVWHLLHFTILKVDIATGTSGVEDPYNNVVGAFEGGSWWMTVIYLLALVALGFHLHHGVFSACQTLGLTNSVASRARARSFGWIVAIVIAGGFALVPLFTLFGVITL